MKLGTTTPDRMRHLNLDRARRGTCCVGRDLEGRARFTINGDRKRDDFAA